METSSRLTLRIFVSSPGDVPAERDRAADVIARLQEEFVHYAILEPFFWEDEPARATRDISVPVPRGVRDGHCRRHPLGPDRYSAPV